MKRTVSRVNHLGTTHYYLVAILTVISLLWARPGAAQSINASVSGVIVDTDGARIPGAQISLVNQDSRSARRTVTDGAGVFDISGVPTGSYTLTVKAKGFETFVEKDIALHP